MPLRRPRFSAIGTAALAMTGLVMTACVPAQGERGQSRADGSAGAAATGAYVSEKLADSASRSADALQTLAMIERSKAGALPMPVDETALPEALQRKVTLDWSGPAADVLGRLSAQIGYRFLESGSKPKASVFVNIGVLDMPAAKVLEQIGMQAYPFATVIVDPNISRVELRYLAAPGVTGIGNTRDGAHTQTQASGRPMPLSASK